MRLIDADELKATMGMFIYQTEDRDNVIATEAYRWELIEREAPTVNAIPIEWLQKKYDKWKDRDVLGWSYCVKLLIEDWEKENEQNKENASQAD